MCEKCVRAFVEALADSFAKVGDMRRGKCSATGCSNIFVTNVPPGEEPELCPPCGGRMPQDGAAN